MPVARTYEKFALKGEPFKENGKMYVYILTHKGEKKVRWYTDTERARMDKAVGLEVKQNDIMDFNARHAFGFGELGYITLYNGSQSDIEDLADKNLASFRQNLTFGYYTPSAISTPDLPDNIKPVKLYWADVMDHDDRMKPHDEVRKYVVTLLNPMASHASSFQGTENQWIQKEVKVKSKKTKDSHFGTKHTYTLVDAEGNTYIWETGAKDYKNDAKVNLKMKVKEHKEIDNEKCTIVWYCKEV